MRPTRLAAPILALALALPLAGCGEDEVPRYEPAGPAEPLFNPCTALDVAEVSRLLGTELAQESGTPDAPVCTFTPLAEGGPVLNANYQQLDSGLDSIFEGMGVEQSAVTQVRVPGADDARVVVDTDGEQLFVSGFVENGDLIQTLDLVDPEPFDRERAVTAVRQVLGLLSGGAPAEITTPSPSGSFGTGSPG